VPDVGRRRSGALPLAALLLALVTQGHNGPPYPILVEAPAGAYWISVWTDPDVGVGRFWILSDVPSGVAAPAPSEVSVTVHPLRDPTAVSRHGAALDPKSRQRQWYVEVPFATEEQWMARFDFEGPAGKATISRSVNVTPPGFGLLDLLLYGAPFLAVAFIWWQAARRKRQIEAAAAGRPGRSGVERIE